MEKSIEQRLDELSQIIIKQMGEIEQLKCNMKILAQNGEILRQENIKIAEKMGRIERTMPSGNYGGMGLY